MKKETKISVWTIILILLSIYLISLSALEYKAYVQSEKFADTIFEMGQNYTSNLSKSIMINAIKNNYSLEEFKVANYEATISRLQNEVSDNWYMDTYFSWRIRAKMHFYMAILAILITIISWRIDKLKKN